MLALDFHSAPATGLRRYTRLVAGCLGSLVDCSVLHWSHPVGVHLALSAELALFPARTVAATWDEEAGWAMVLTPQVSEHMVVLRYLGEDIVPPPHVVAAFSTRLLRGEFPGQAESPAGHAEDIEARLATYATTRRDRRRTVPRPFQFQGMISTGATLAHEHPPD